MGLDLNLPSGVTAEQEQDVLGGGGILESGVYPGTIEMVYLLASASGAQGITIHFNKDGQVIKNTTYISTGLKDDGAGNKAVRYTYKDREGIDKPLPGYSQMNSFFKAVTGKGIGEQVSTSKVINVWDYKSKSEKPTEVTVFTDALDQRILIGVMKVSEEKTLATSKNPNNRPYTEGTGEFRDFNEFAKYFDVKTGLTVSEKAAGLVEPEFLGKWKDKNTGKTRIKKAKIPGVANGAVAGAPVAPGANVTTPDPFA
jgi:hypothetical protein